MVKGFFEGIQWLFENILFLPHEFLRGVELTSWWIANCVNFFFLLIGIVALVYWSKKLKDFDDKGEEDKDVTAHSFL
tara:strand:- start:1278 stop:1508 length:231 start_codon:yes stop_codon:yes gene_type:complete